MRVESPESLPSPEPPTLPPRRRRSSPLLGNRHGVFGALALELRKGFLEGEGRVRVAANPSTQVPVKAPTPAQPASYSLARPGGLGLTRVTEGGPGRTNDLGSLETVGERGRPDPDAAPWSAFARPNAGSTSFEPTQSPHHRTPRSASIRPGAAALLGSRQPRWPRRVPTESLHYPLSAYCAVRISGNVPGDPGLSLPPPSVPALPALPSPQALTALPALLAMLASP